MTATDEALAYLKEQMGEGWDCAVFIDQEARSERWIARAYHVAYVEIVTTGPDPMSAARACVEAWREATTALRENLEFRENDLAVSRARENAEREHADRLAEALRNVSRLHPTYSDWGTAELALAAHDARRAGSGEGE